MCILLVSNFAIASRPQRCACAETLITLGLPQPDSSRLCSVNTSEVTQRVYYGIYLATTSLPASYAQDKV